MAVGGTHLAPPPSNRGNPLALLRRIVVAATAMALLQAGCARPIGQSLPRRARRRRSARDWGPRPRDGTQLHERGYVADQNLVFERRAAQGKLDRLPG